MSWDMAKAQEPVDQVLKLFPDMTSDKARTLCILEMACHDFVDDSETCQITTVNATLATGFGRPQASCKNPRRWWWIAGQFPCPPHGFPRGRGQAGLGGYAPGSAQALRHPSPQPPAQGPSPGAKHHAGGICVCSCFQFATTGSWQTAGTAEALAALATATGLLALTIEIEVMAAIKARSAWVVKARHPETRSM